MLSGNVGLHNNFHTTNDFGLNRNNPPTAALNGQQAVTLINKYCAHPTNSDTLPA